MKSIFLYRYKASAINDFLTQLPGNRDVNLHCCDEQCMSWPSERGFIASVEREGSLPCQSGITLQDK